MSEPTIETAIETELESLPVDAPRVGIVMGSKSDMPAMEKAAKELTERGILHEVRVMSAHRDPEMVAEYAKNARMRGLRVIIAGAGLSAALPGVVAAHTDLPVIGVPLTSSTSRRGRARRAAVDRPDAAGRAGGLRGRGQRAERGGTRRSHTERVIARYTRPEIGAIWTDEARFTAMRDVEVAAAEALDGPTPEDLEAIRAATFTVEAIDEREKILDHDTAAFVDVLAASAGPAGRWIHYGLTSSDVVDTGLALQLQAGGCAARAGDPRARVGAAREGATSTPGHAVRRPHPRRPRRADLVRAQARGLRDGDAPQRGAARARLRPDHGGDLRRGRHVRDAWARTTRSAWRRGSGCITSRSRPRSSRATATRSC